MTIQLAMVGCGKIADTHFKAIASLKNARLVATVDSELERASSAASLYGAERASTAYDEVLADDEVDAVILCLPHHLHAPFSIRAAEAGKHILVEKPMALDEGESLQMVQAAENAGVQLSIGQSSRYIPAYWKTRELLASNSIGRIVNILHQRTFFIDQLSTDWRRVEGECGGLYLPLFGSHDIDAILWMLSTRPRRIWSSLLSASPVSAGDSDGIVGIDLENGAVASLAFATRCKRARTETLFVGEDGHLQLRRNGIELNGEQVAIDDSEEAFTHQMRLFVEALIAGTAVPAPGREVLAVMRTLDLAKKAHATGQAQSFLI
ncbi:MAG: Gfo/Idh/MocA family protein [Candidatus Latescibacterota bacterium]|jgi:predicted dehydrogenase